MSYCRGADATCNLHRMQPVRKPLYCFTRTVTTPSDNTPVAIVLWFRSWYNFLQQRIPFSPHTSSPRQRIPLMSPLHNLIKHSLGFITTCEILNKTLVYWFRAFSNTPITQCTAERWVSRPLFSKSITVSFM